MGYTILKDTENEIVIDKSRFICTLCKISSEQEAQDHIKSIKKKYWDATHNCSAYIVNEMLQRSSDDGEPSGTAGIPMLEVLRKLQICGVLAVVTRYFGGIKLGVGGLARAYTTSVSKAIQKAGLAEQIEMGLFEFVTTAESIGKILNILYSDGKYLIEHINYGVNVQIIFKIRKSDIMAAKKYLTDLLQMNVELKFLSSDILEIAVRNGD